MIRPRPEVLSAPLPAYAESARNHDSSPVRLDFSTTLNAWGPAPVVLHALRAARPDVYPDPEALAPRQAASARWGRPVEEITFWAGATELIHAVCFAFLRSIDTVLVPGPTFGEYARAAALCGARVLQGTATPPAYALEIPAISAAVIQHRPRLAFLCSPNNPTGQSFGRDELRGLADACAAAGSLLVLDQSFDAFTAQPLGVPALPDHPAVLHLRSFTQDHALAGVRAAFAVGAAPVVAGLARARPPGPLPPRRRQPRRRRFPIQPTPIFWVRLPACASSGNCCSPHSPGCASRQWPPARTSCWPRWAMRRE
ncbi:hypothetical protein BH20GEM3_BH20GEM3_04110 [soil metagenome]